MKLKKLIAGAAVAVMVCASVMSSAGAYFTDNESAKGGEAYTYNATMQTSLKEQADTGSKKLQVANEGDVAVKVRARLFYPSEYESLVDYEASENWTEGEDGWYYYNETVEPGAETTVLNLTIRLPLDMNGKVSQTINVVAAYEAIPATADWDAEEVSE